MISNFDKCKEMDLKSTFYQMIFNWSDSVETLNTVLDLKKIVFGSLTEEYMLSLNQYWQCLFMAGNYKKALQFCREYFDLIASKEDEVI